jgi:hypothetical protein
MDRSYILGRYRIGRAIPDTSQIKELIGPFGHKNKGNLIS